MPTIHSVFEIARKTIQAKKRILLIALVLLLVVSVFVGSSIYKRNYFSHIVSQMLRQYPFADNGVGVSEEHINRLFERFYRVDKSHSKETGGTGLGLSIVKHGAMLHGAKIHVDSKLGEGTKIELIF